MAWFDLKTLAEKMNSRKSQESFKKSKKTRQILIYPSLKIGIPKSRSNVTGWLKPVAKVLLYFNFMLSGAVCVAPKRIKVWKFGITSNARELTDMYYAAKK